MLALASHDTRSPLHGASEARSVRRTAGCSSRASRRAARATRDILRRNGRRSVEATVESKPGEEAGEVLDARFRRALRRGPRGLRLGLVRVGRVVTGCGGGRIINEKTARSQMIGGIVGGLGMALTEETVMDHRKGRFVNANLGQYTCR